MHPFSVLTLGIFIAGYITARWDLVTRLYELAIFAWDHGVVVRKLESLSLRGLTRTIAADEGDEGLCDFDHHLFSLRTPNRSHSCTRDYTGMSDWFQTQI